MDGRGDPGTGIGPASTGPEFAPPDRPATGPNLPLVPPTGVRPPYAGPPASRLPAVLTTAAVVLVALVVAIASLVAHHADTHIAAPVTRPVVIPSPTERADRIEFTTSTGSGELILLSRTWDDEGSPVPTNGSYLKIEVEIDCVAGSVDYDPNNFQAFDHNGQLFDLVLDEAEEPALEIGTLEAGMRTRGHLAFDISHGDVTLLMSEDNEQSVTALRVPV